MTITALARLRHRSDKLTAKLAFGTATEIQSARELLRQSLVELYQLGYWREHPADMRTYMRLYRSCAAERFSAPPSMSVPDKTAQYSP